jgi:hypothetical protein
LRRRPGASLFFGALALCTLHCGGSGGGRRLEIEHSGESFFEALTPVER